MKKDPFPLKKPLSLRLRLSIFFTLAILVTWLCAAAIIWYESEEYIHEFFDTQQLLFAKRLSAASLSDLIGTPVGGKLKEVEIQKKYQGNTEDDALSFAIFSHYGHELLNDGMHKEQFIFHPSFTGFEDAHVKGSSDLWRIVWLPSEDGRFMVAVGQELEYRQDMVFDLAAQQLLPWFILLPVLLLGQFWLLSRELAPIRQIGDQLKIRDPKDSTPLPAAHIPSEVQPLLTSLNHLFERTSQMITRERTLVATAAHELRTPLAGLRVQAEVAKLCADDPQALESALTKLLEGIDRSSHLAEQLLTLSRMDALHESQQTNQNLQTKETLDWALLFDEAIASHQDAAQVKNIQIHYIQHALPAVRKGYPTLISTLLRNLLDNAVAYTPENGQIRIISNQCSLCVENTCHPIPQETLSRLGERFYRIPGQSQPGSGLGLPIIKRIAEIHNFHIFWGLRDDPETSNPFFYVQLNFQTNS